MLQNLARIHQIDLVETGLEKKLAVISPREFVEQTWNRYIDFNSPWPMIDYTAQWLLENLPTDEAFCLVHNDFRNGNFMINEEGIIAVLDWELCTLGDPLADLGLLMVYWSGPTDEPSGTTFGTTTAKGFLNRGHLAERYAQVSGRDISHLDYYVAFAYWKLACIIEGVYARYISGAMGEQSDTTAFEPFKLQVEASAQKAELLLSRLQ